jgi:hypothetical protein
MLAAADKIHADGLDTLQPLGYFPTLSIILVDKKSGATWILRTRAGNDT